MVATFSRKRLILPMAPAGGAMMGLIASALFALIPGEVLGQLILRSGLPAIVAAAEPPLGLTARLVLILLGGGGIGLFAWFALFLILGSRTIALGKDGADDEDEQVPVLRRADAHPDAPSRRPVFANRDLGTPFLEVRAPQAPVAKAAPLQILQPVSLPPDVPPDALPKNLDLPMAAFDPGAIRGIVPPAHEPAPVPVAEPAKVSPPVSRQSDVLPDAVPKNVDLPLPAFDPRAIRDNALPPYDPPVAVQRPHYQAPVAIPAPELEPPARRQVFAANERFETFELTPVRPPAETPPEPAPRREPRDTQATISALLDRLERGVSDRAVRAAVAPHDPVSQPPAPRQIVPHPQPEPIESPQRDAGLEQTLVTLRRMAMRG